MRASPTVSSLSEIAERIPEAPAGVGPSREAIAAVVAAIAERFRPERIVLFGSRAYGVPEPESDIDLMVLVDTAERPSDLVRRIHEALGPTPVRLDIKVQTPARTGLGLAEGDFFFLDVMLLGVTLYARDGTSMTETRPDQAGDGRRSLKLATSEWLAKAPSDFDLAERAVGPPRPLWDGACFHLQQFTEKYLKALLQEHGVRFPLTHDLARLDDLAAGTAPSLAPLRSDLAWLSDYAVAGRYPGVVTEQADAERALRVATDVRGLVRDALGLGEAGGG